MAKRADAIFGKAKQYRDKLPKGCEVVWKRAGHKHLVVKWNDGRYRAAILIDSDAKRYDPITVVGGFRLTKGSASYIVDSKSFKRKKRAKARIPEWEREYLARMLQRANEKAEKAKRKLEIERARPPKNLFWNWL